MSYRVTQRPQPVSGPLDDLKNIVKAPLDALKNLVSPPAAADPGSLDALRNMSATQAPPAATRSAGMSPVLLLGGAALVAFLVLRKKGK